MEQHFRDIFKEHELPYEAQAWDQLSKKLDVVMPTAKSNGNWKWYLSASVILLSASGLFWNLTSKTSVRKDDKISSASTDQKPTENKVQESNESTSVSSLNAFTANDRNSEKAETSNLVSSMTSSTSENNQGGKVEDTKTTQKFDINSVSETQNKTNNTNPEAKVTETAMVYPTVKDLCEGESIWIKNENSQDLFISDNSKVYPVSAGKRINFIGENPGNYYFGHAVNGKIQYSKTADFKVREGIKADFTIDNDTKYEQGVPTVTLQASSNENASYTWKLEGAKTELKGKDVKAHLYQKGTYDVVLTAEPKDNGCPVNVKKQVHIEEDYNLLAVNSFWPNSNDPRNATFMPYALKERNADFTMMIIDPTNGVTLFETNDATNGWNGTNKTNGQLVDANKAYIWIVRMKNPLPDEKAEYKGTIVRLP